MYKLCEYMMGLWKRFSIAAVLSGDKVEECKSGADTFKQSQQRGGYAITQPLQDGVTQNVLQEEF